MITIELLFPQREEDWKYGPEVTEVGMFSHHGKLSRTARSSLPMPRVNFWRTWTALTCLALLATLRWAGSRHSAWDRAHGSWGRGWVPQIFNGLARVLTNAAPLSLRLACLALLIAVLWALRRALLVRNAYRPGPVEVKDLVTAAPEARQQPSVADLSAQFRKQLSETDLYPPSTLPAEPPAENFLDLLGDVDLEPAKLGTSLLRLTSRLRPKIAYRVSGVLREQDPEPRFGVTVTVTSYAIRGSRMETVWARSWEEAVRRAGYWVAAALLPVTRAGKTPPWRHWRGRDLPADLFAAYQQARENGRNRRFDEALRLYFLALQYDPTNLYLRTQIGGTQEKLGLYLDALETYYGALTLGTHSSRPRYERPWQRGDRKRRTNDRLWVYRWPWRRFNCLWCPWWQRGVLQARYRYAVVLGMSEITAHQWCRRSGQDGSAEHRREIRKSLTPALVARYWPSQPFPSAGAVTDAEGQERERQQLLRETLVCGTYREVRLVFQRACAQEMCRLAQDYPIARFIPGMVSGEVLTRSALRINRDVWAPLRLAWAYGLGTAEPAMAERKRLRWPRRVYKRVASVRWPATAEELVPRVERARRRWRGSHEWQDHYNAACVYAFAMHGHRSRTHEKRRDELAELATRELEEAVRSAEGGFLTLKRSWLLSEDPDLAVLRRESRFARFERETYPHATPITKTATTSRCRPRWRPMIANC